MARKKSVKPTDAKDSNDSQLKTGDVVTVRCSVVEAKEGRAFLVATERPNAAETFVLPSDLLTKE